MELPAAGEHVASSDTGKRRRSVKRSLEYPCVSRFRHRRLLAYLRRHRLVDSFGSLALETDVFFWLEHLQELARRGKWVDAIKYIARFTPSGHILGDQGQVFYHFVVMHRVLESIAAGEEFGASIAGEYERYLKENPGAPPGNVKLASILLSVLKSDKLRASINWDLVRHKAADMIEDLIQQVPEFNDLLRMPNCPSRPHNVLPIGFSSRPRRHVKGVDRVPASNVAHFYLEKRRSLPFPSHSHEAVSSLELSFEATAKLADVLAESVEAGMHRVPRGRYPLAYSCNEGVPGASVTRAIRSIMTNPNSGISTESDAGMKHLVCTEAVAHHDCRPRNIKKRSRTGEYQEFDTRKRQITRVCSQHAGLSPQAYCSVGDGSVRDMGCDMTSWIERSGDCSSPPEIPSS
ncbi:hypothetical protein QOZ80_4AG0303910 [Eleusine coracana subsp. coracana]|nr:hypothetical protein QOZ80_4AG0303910 [Eleusine coracana subsp. coracana]